MKGGKNETEEINSQNMYRLVTGFVYGKQSFSTYSCEGSGRKGNK